MQSTITMGHAPAVRASRALRAINVRKMCARAISLARRKSVTLAVISAALAVFGAAAEVDTVTFSAALSGLAAVALANSGKKGGDK